MSGRNLLNFIAELTGLPNDRIIRELQNIVQSKGLSVDDIELDDLREALASYLQEAVAGAHRRFYFE